MKTEEKGIGSKMQRRREVRNNFSRPSSPFDDFGFPGGFPSIFGGRDPFDDPFFTHSFGTSFGPSMFSTPTTGNVQHRSRLSGPVIEEFDVVDDDESVLEQNGYGHDSSTHAARVNRNPIVEHPEDQVNDQEKSNGKHVSHKIGRRDKLETQPRTSVSFQRVTYGGINGEYSTAMTTRKIGNDGVTVEESKQADRTTGLATHRISRGINNKGHSITRTLDSDGKVEKIQTLHNLNQDELAGFEQTWKDDAERNLHGGNDGFDFLGGTGTSGNQHGPKATWGGFFDPFKGNCESNGEPSLDHNFQVQSSRARPKKVFTVNIE
ncbi:uncharacterized protein [Primulina huaijiensis]|uniref:uncharacterized protein isoform X2 n=1 Tax=Primulina huaijiensis TaxID=1492673 RepID=UPI003CC77E9A